LASHHSQRDISDCARTKANPVRPIYATSLRFLQQTSASAIKLAPLVRCQTANTRLGDFLEDGIDRFVNVFFQPARRRWFRHNFKFWFWLQTSLKISPPGELGSGAAHFNKKKTSGDARPHNGEVSPGVISEQLERVDRTENQR